MTEPFQAIVAELTDLIQAIGPDRPPAPARVEQALARAEAVLHGRDAGDPAWARLQSLTGSLLALRGGIDDQDQAIERWGHVVAAALAGTLDVPVLSAPAAAAGGDLLVQRAHRRRDPADALEAVRWLAHALEHPTDGEDFARWHLLGVAHHTAWQYGRTPGNLTSALGCLENALRADPPGADELLEAVRERLVVTIALFDTDGSPIGPAELRKVAERSAAVLDGAERAGRRSRARLAIALVAVEFMLQDRGPGGLDTARVRALLDRTVGADLDDTDRGRVLAFRGLLDPHTAAGFADLAAGAKLLPADYEPAAAQMLATARAGRAVSHGDLRGQDAAVDQLHATPPGVPGSGDAQLQALLLQAGRHGLAGDRDAYAAVLARAKEFLTRADVEPVTAELVAHLDRLITRPASGPLPIPVICPADAGPLPLSQIYLHGSDLNTARFWAEQVDDRPALRQIRDSATAPLTHVPPAERMLRMAVLECAGSAELALAGHDAAVRVEAARRAAAHLAAARTIAGGPHHARWPSLSMKIGYALDLAGDAREPAWAEVRRAGRSALLGHAWRVLLQAGTDYAIEAARTAADDARIVAAWCWQHATTARTEAARQAALHDLVAVLDSGRGLVLQAAAASRSIADQLDEAGQPDLARRWRETGGATDPGEADDDLRLRVLQVLHPAGAEESELLDAVRVDDVRAALTGAGFDALVYLVPSGYAVIVPVAGPVDRLALPRLATPPPVPAAAAGRDLGPASSQPASGSLDELCRWAWTAAVGDLAGYAARWGLRRPARLVLVPMGSLGLVPWPAARHAGRYAVQDIVFSVTVSARVFCRSARHPLRPIGSALIVGDPRGDLPFADLEARAVHRVFHPTGTYLDRATSGQVLAWVADAGRGPSVLHLACHGRVDRARPQEACLQLADGPLTVGRLLEASRLAGLELDRVLLAACTTGVTGGDADEVVSLATTLLAAGAHTVFGTLWAVPDAETGLLMYMVHHYLAAGCQPVDALHRAQLWMLDPHREPPPQMPADLARLAGRAAAADPLSWAAFTHLGR